MSEFEFGICKGCGKDFLKAKANHIFCCNSCAQRYYRSLKPKAIKEKVIYESIVVNDGKNILKELREEEENSKKKYCNPMVCKKYSTCQIRKQEVVWVSSSSYQWRSIKLCSDKLF